MKSSLAFLLLIIAAVCARAATFVVTNTNDSGPGSLLQAVLDANADSLADQITFNIPGDGWAVIRPAANLVITQPVTIDGYTQPGAKPNTLSFGSNAVLRIDIDYAEVYVDASNCVLRGLITRRNISIFGDNNIIAGCFIGNGWGGGLVIGIADQGKNNLIGTTAVADRNIVTWIRIGQPDATNQTVTGNVVINNYVGIGADGKPFAGPGDAYVSINRCGGNVIGGSAPGARNVIGGALILQSADRNLVQGNFIGTDATGLSASPHDGGVRIFGPGYPLNHTPTQNKIIGNVISADQIGGALPGFAGIRIYSESGPLDASGNVIQGNFIGVGSDGKTPLGSTTRGIDLQPGIATNTLVGGTNPGDGNVIAFNGRRQAISPGAIVGDPSTVIEGNSIFANVGPGIDLLGPDHYGPVPNDPGDQEVYQNYPVIDSVSFNSGSVQVSGRLNSRANTHYRVEFFGNESADASGYGEGQHFLGFVNVTTDANGSASFAVTLPATSADKVISATATGPTGTSEFSRSIPAATVSTAARLLNISTRTNVQLGDTIAGFIITGDDAKTVLIRGLGPSLAKAGIPAGALLQDPTLTLHNSVTYPLAVSWDWDPLIKATGLAPDDPKESALLVTLPPGNYTAVLGSQPKAPDSQEKAPAGIGLIEVYDVSQSTVRLGNISTRGFVGTGDNVLIGGFIIGPDAGGNARVVVRGIGPSLASVANRLQDPVVELHGGNGALLASNDDWKTNEAEVRATGLPPTDDHESALVADLLPGNYTLVLRGKNNTAGVGLVEIYNLP